MTSFREGWTAMFARSLSDTRQRELLTKFDHDPRVVLTPQSWGSMVIQFNSNRFTRIASLSMSPVTWNPVTIQVQLSTSGWRYGHNFPTTWNVRVEENETPWAFILRVTDEFILKFRKPSSQGSVKVFTDQSEMFWVWKRPSSDSFVEHEGKYFLRETDARIRSVHHTSLTEREELFIPESEFNRDYVRLNGKHYHKNLLTSVYYNSWPFEEISRYVLPDQAEDRFEFVLVNDERRYIDVRISENNLDSTPVHGYTTRVEHLIPEAKLFLKGEQDLYARRPKEETPFLGFELEAVTRANESSARAIKKFLPDLVICKSDSSIGGHGFETVSIPATLDFWKESNLDKTLDTMRLPPYSMRSFENSSCGFHVHVSRSALSVLDLQKLERFVHNPNNKDFMVAVANRAGNTYQNYNPRLFNDRKNLAERSSSGGQTTFEGIDYFAEKDYLINESVRVGNPNGSLDSRISHFFNFISSWISYGSLSNILRLSSSASELQEKYRTYYTYCSWDAWHSEASRAWLYKRSITAWFNIVGSGLDDPETEKEKFYQFIKDTYTPLFEGRPFLHKLLHTILPEFFSEPPVDVNTTDTEQPSWKSGIRKSSAPFKRQLSFSAAQTISGPVGKAVSGRYDVLNTRNQNTVEFRLFKGTMNSTTVFRYLEFVDAIVRFAASTSATDEGLSYQAFVRWLISDPFNVARYEHLVAFVIEKGFVERAAIRRKKLPDVAPDDSNTEGLVALSLPELMKKERKPVGIIQIPTEVVEEAAQPRFGLPVQVEGYDPDFDGYIEPPEDDDDDYCDCDDCRRNRGEDVPY
jgi:hypothetical protein